MKLIHFLALVLTLVGAINWGLWGFFQFDLVAWLAHGNTTWLARFIYAVVGLGGVWSLRLLGKCKEICGCCDKGGSCGQGGTGGSSGGSCKM